MDNKQRRQSSAQKRHLKFGSLVDDSVAPFMNIPFCFNAFHIDADFYTAASRTGGIQFIDLLLHHESPFLELRAAKAVQGFQYLLLPTPLPLSNFLVDVFDSIDVRKRGKFKESWQERLDITGNDQSLLLIRFRHIGINVLEAEVPIKRAAGDIADGQKRLKNRGLTYEGLAQVNGGHAVEDDDLHRPCFNKS